jgi:hypothetical protein
MQRYRLKDDHERYSTTNLEADATGELAHRYEHAFGEGQVDNVRLWTFRPLCNQLLLQAHPPSPILSRPGKDK